jgi:hypothetical protein
VETRPVVLASCAARAGRFAGAAASHGLALAALWWPPAFLLAIGYAVWVSRRFAKGPDG